MRRLLTLSILLACCGLIACHSASDTIDDLNGNGGTYAQTDAQVSDAETSSADAAVDSTPLFGNFGVNYFPAVAKTATTDAADARAAFFGKLWDGIDPDSLVWTKIDSSGDCSLSTPSAPFCENGCGGDKVCAGDGQCQAYANKELVGNLHVSGITDDELTIKPVSDNYQVVGNKLAYPPCKEGADLTLRADGGAFAPFELSTKCIAPLVSTGKLAITEGKPIDLKWTKPGQADLGRIQLKVDLSHHGGIKGKIECETADDGELEIAAKLVDQLVALGVAGFPYLEVSRIERHAGSTPQTKNVTFSVDSTLVLEVQVPGVVSCTTDDMCPKGQTCQHDLQCG